MKEYVYVTTVMANAPYLYPNRKYIVVKKKGEAVLLETENGTRMWVHQSFTISSDGSVR